MYPVYRNSNIALIINGKEVDGKVLALSIKSKLNEHVELELTYDSYGDDSMLFVPEIYKNTISIELWRKKSEGDSYDKENLFNGKLTWRRQNFRNSSGLRTLKGISITKDLDIDKVRRSFQDSKEKLGSIATTICKENGVDVICEKVEKSVESLLLQYNETNWEFLNRIASLEGKPVIVTPYCIHFGFPSGQKAREEKLEYSGVSIEDSIDCGYTFLIDSDQIMGLGEEVDLDLGEGKYTTRVIESEIYLDGHDLQGRYKVQEDCYFKVEGKGNEKIKGEAIEGEIVEVVKNSNGGIAVLKIDFYEQLNRRVESCDKCEKNQTLFEFPYITPYSKNNSGYFCSPEEGDNVTVYFPSNSEKHGIIIGAVNNIGSERFNNPDYRYFESEGYSMTINKGVVDVRNREKTTTIDGMNRVSSSDMAISCSKNIEIASKGAVNLSGVSSTESFGKVKKISAPDILTYGLLMGGEY